MSSLSLVGISWTRLMQGDDWVIKVDHQHRSASSTLSRPNSDLFKLQTILGALRPIQSITTGHHTRKCWWWEEAGKSDQQCLPVVLFHCKQVSHLSPLPAAPYRSPSEPYPLFKQIILITLPKPSVRYETERAHTHLLTLRASHAKTLFLSVFSVEEESFEVQLTTTNQ